MIPLLRLLFAAALSALPVCAIRLLDWSASGIPPWKAEGPWTCIVLAAAPCAAVAVLVVAWALRCLVWLLAEAEARGEAPA